MLLEELLNEREEMRLASVDQRVARTFATFIS